MKTVRQDYEQVDTQNGTAVAIGNFDGLHKGHLKLMSMLSRIAKEHELPSVAYTFEIHPINVLKGPNTLKLVAKNEQKERLIERTGVDVLFFEDFARVKDMEPVEFVRDILVEKLNMKIAVVGRHNHYGKDSAGDVKLLRELGQSLGFEVYMIEPLYIGDSICSSTRIRQLIAEGEIEQANELLGSPFTISNIVVQDKMLGRTIGYPTANMIPEDGILLPKFGVYATNTYINGEKFASITNVGTNPSFPDSDVRIETNIFGFDGDVYDKTIDVEFIKRMRDSVSFPDLEELKEQLQKDEQARLAIG